MPARPVPFPLLRLLAAVIVIGGVVVPASSAGAALGCGLLGLTGTCHSGGTLATPPAAAGTADPVTCGGAATETVHGRRWLCTFDDEFDGTQLDRSTWVVQTTADAGFHSGGECLVDSPDNVAVSGGTLALTVRRAAQPFSCASPKGAYQSSWTGGSVYTRTFGQLYGRFEFRARFVEAAGQPGLQGALWTYRRPIANPGVGGVNEIDVAEAYSRYQDWVAPAVHSYLSGRSVPCQVPDYGAGFHTYAVEWTRRAALFYYDDKLCMRATGTGSNGPFLVALSQVIGVTTNVPTPTTPGWGTMQVDWVRVWK